MHIVELHVQKGSMLTFFSIDYSKRHDVVSANSHFYDQPTEPLYINRTLQYHDLIYLVDGQWTITENEIDYPLTKDDVLLLSAGYHHYTRLPCLAQTKTLCIHISSEASDHSNSPHCLRLPTKMNVRSNPAIRLSFEHIIHTFWSNKPYKKEYLSSLLDGLILQLVDIHIGAGSVSTDISDEIIKLISENPHVRYKCADIAQLYHVSTKTIETAMLKNTGMSFSKYQNARKLEMVVSQMHVEPDMRLSELAGLFGFYDEFHLSRMFKQFYGVSPSQYKKTMMNDDSSCSE